MKKIISVLLALLMLLGPMTLAISATDSGNDGAGAVEEAVTQYPSSGHIFYEQNFDGEELLAPADPAPVDEGDGSGEPITPPPAEPAAPTYKTGADLLEALGWDAPDENADRKSVV